MHQGRSRSPTCTSCGLEGLSHLHLFWAEGDISPVPLLGWKCSLTCTSFGLKGLSHLYLFWAEQVEGSRTTYSRKWFWGSLLCTIRISLTLTLRQSDPINHSGFALAPLSRTQYVATIFLEYVVNSTATGDITNSTTVRSVGVPFVFYHILLCTRYRILCTVYNTTTPPWADFPWSISPQLE